MTLSSAKITGNPGPSGWSQVHEFAPTEADKLEARGRLFAVVGTSVEKEGVDSVSAGRELLARVHEEYFGHLEGTIFNALKTAVETVIKEFSETWGDVEIAAVCVLKGVVYSVAAGGAQVVIERGGALAKILTSIPGGVTSASGYPKEGDFLVFGTKKFFEVIDQDLLKEGLATGEVTTAAETFAPKIHAREDAGNLGGIILQFSVSTAPLALDVPAQESVNQKETKILISEFLLKAKRTGLKILNILPERKIYVRPDKTDEFAPDSKKTTLSVGAIILILLMISIGFGIRQKGVKEARGKYAERLTSAEHSYDESLSLAELSPDRARELFSESKSLTEALTKEGVKDKRLTTLIEKINTSQASILGEFSNEPELFLDLSLLTSGFNGSDLAASGENLFVLDSAARRVVRIAIDTKKTETVAGPDDISSAQKVAGYEDRAFVLGDTGIFEVGETKAKVVEDSWEGEVLPYAFAANIYVLEKATGPAASGPEGRGVIWRYPGSSASFGEKQNWFGEGVKPNFAGAVGMTIDGAVWVLSDNGKILKFSQGSPQNFSPQGVNPALTLGTAIYTNEENNFVYVLDRTGKRIVVLAKDGKYKAQYVNDKIAEATDLAVSEKEGKIILLAGAKLYSLAIKHL